MRTRLIGSLLAAGVVLFPVLGGALDSPHDRSGANASACSFCHALYSPSPTGAYDYSAACLSCHNQEGRAPHVKWGATTESVPGTAGTSHAWSRPAVNTTYGTKALFSVALAGLLVDGKLQCVICHDPHTTAVAKTPTSMGTSIPVGEPQIRTGNTLQDPTGSGTLTLDATPGARGAAFRVKIQTLSAGSGTFIVSHDYAWKADSWLNFVSNAWVAGTSDGAGRTFQEGTAVALDIPGVSITISANARVGDYWDFYISYPFLRFTNTTDDWCYQCHKEQKMNHVRARGADLSYLPNGSRKFSHPVGVGLNANGFNTDRGTALDADGTAGSSATDGLDGVTPVANSTNDLVFRGGVVGCTTCHAAHNADSNSLTVDAH